MMDFVSKICKPSCLPRFLSLMIQTRRFILFSLCTFFSFLIIISHGAKADLASPSLVRSRIQQEYGIVVSTSMPPDVQNNVASVGWLYKVIDEANSILGITTNYYLGGGNTDNRILSTGFALLEIQQKINKPQCVNHSSDDNVLLITCDTNFVVPNGFTRIDVFAVGGGGAGAGDSNKCGSGGAGGIGGQVKYSTINVSSGQIIPVVIGAGGVGGTNFQVGKPGGATKFGSVSASGGAGGLMPNKGCDSVVGTPGANGTASPILVTETSGKLFGAGGGDGNNSYCCPPDCCGATPPLAPGGATGGGRGGGGLNNTADNRGGDGTFYGAGGGGASFTSSHSTSLGGSGYQGIVIIRLYN